MKASVISVFKNHLFDNGNDELFKFIKLELFKKNVDVEKTMIVHDAKRNFAKNLDALLSSDLIFVLTDDKSAMNVKKEICEYFSDELLENTFAYNFITSSFAKRGLKPLKEDRLNIMLPSRARSIVNKLSSRCGFILEENDKIIIFLTNDVVEFKAMFKDSVLTFLDKNKKIYCEMFKIFGLNKDEITMLIGNEKRDDTITIKIQENFPEANIYIRYKEQTLKVVLDDLKDDIISRLNEFIITDENITLSQLALQILEVQEKTFSCYETFTAGKLIQTIVSENSEARKLAGKCVINVDFCAENKKITDAIYDITLQYLKESKTNVVLSLIEDVENPGVFYVAIGDVKNIHIFKDAYKVGCGTSFHDYAIKTALFYLIKKLKFKDF